MKNIPNLFTISIKSLLKNKRRNFFTMIGIIIGIAAVITIMSIGEGFERDTIEEIESSSGSENSIIINFIEENNTASHPFSSSDIDIVEQIEGVQSANIREDDNFSFSAKITYPEAQSVNIYRVESLMTNAQSDNITPIDNELERKVITVDENLADSLYDGEALNKTLFIEGESFKIVGIDPGPSQGFESNIISMPINSFDKYLNNLSQGFYELEVNLQDRAELKESGENIANELNDRGSGTNSGSYSYVDLEEVTASFSTILSGITYFITAVAAISLFISGIGVMNVMYISVSERTEEIAIRRAFGAKRSEIELQFLIESIVLCFTGGVIGIIIGVGISQLIALIIPNIYSITTISSILISLGVSTTIGIIFGWVPARLAAKKNLIDIIK